MMIFVLKFPTHCLPSFDVQYKFDPYVSLDKKGLNKT